MPSTLMFVGVVFGGVSDEHNVSIKSAITVVNALKSGVNASRFIVIPIYIDKKGRWWPEAVAERALEKSFALEESELPRPLLPSGFTALPPGTEKIQVWYPVLHGPNGEDGTVQGLFKLTGKPFVGSGVLGSALGMDKLAMKAAFASVGLPQLPYIPVAANNLSETSFWDELLKKIGDEFRYPLFVKPANLGSSIGITKALNRKQLEEGLQIASKFDQRIIIEQGVIAKELECAVFGKSKMKASEVGEISFDAEWYDYKTKYSEGSSNKVIPALIPGIVKEKVRLMAIKACRAVVAEGMARVDFFYEEGNDEIWINEINTLPGFTSQSMYPVLWEASGVTIEDLVAKLVYAAGE